MKYFSGRSGGKVISGSEAIIKGIGDDGGLFVPVSLPEIDLEKLKGLSYKELAFQIISKFFPELPEDKLKIVIDRYKVFNRPEPAAITSFDEVSFLELYHGPTASFKDMALTLLPGLMKISYEVNGLDEEILILVATSGDTGSAALKGFSGQEGTSIAVFYPNSGVSEIQMIQMESAADGNAYVYSITGNFDDAQRAVKEIFNDKEIQKLEKAKKTNVSSANSINIGRLVPQIVYYIYSYLKLSEEGIIKFGEPLDVSVPTGNFGNILACIYAKEMGVPFGNIISASNSNDVLYDFITTKKYDAKRDFKKTISPSMDILISSNLERFLYLNSGEDHEYLKSKYESLQENGEFVWEKKLPEYLKAGRVDDEETRKLIKKVLEEKEYLIDPHTAVAYGASKKSENHCLVVSTASPFKFNDAVLEALGIDSEGLSLKEKIEKLEEIGKIEAPESIKGGLSEIDEPAFVLDKSEIKEVVKDILEE